MTNDKLLDQVEQWLGNHHTIEGHPFSEESLLQHIRNVRADVKRKEAIAGTAKPMNGMDVIPEMIDPLGKHWDQPDRQYIFIRDGKAHVCPQDFQKLASYDRSLPSSVYPGKMWKRTNSGVSYLCWYGEEKGGECSINSMPIEVAQQEVAA